MFSLLSPPLIQHDEITVILERINITSYKCLKTYDSFFARCRDRNYFQPFLLHYIKQSLHTRHLFIIALFKNKQKNIVILESVGISRWIKHTDPRTHFCTIYWPIIKQWSTVSWYTELVSCFPLLPIFYTYSGSCRCKTILSE